MSDINMFYIVYQVNSIFISEATATSYSVENLISNGTVAVTTTKIETIKYPLEAAEGGAFAVPTILDTNAIEI